MPEGKKKKKGSVLDKLFAQAERLVAVDVGSRFVKIAAFRRRKEAIEPTVLDIEPIPYVSARGDITPVQVREALATVLHRNNIKSSSFISMLPLEFVSIKRFEVPSVSREQIEQMVPFEAEKHIPFALDRAVLDFHFAPIGEAKTEKDKDTATPAQPTSEQAQAAQQAADAIEAAGAKSVVTLAAVRLAVIPKFLELCQVRGCKQHAIDVTGFALYNALSYYLRANPVASDSEDTVMIDIGARRTELIVVSASTGDLVFTRSIDFGGDALTEYIASHQDIPFEEAERLKCEEWGNTVLAVGDDAYDKAFEPLATQLDQTIRFMRKSGVSAKQGQVWLAGGTSSAPGIVEYLQSRLDVPVQVFDPVSLVGARTESTCPPAFAVAVGGALRIVNEAKFAIDLLPVDIAKLQQQALRKRRLMQLGVAAGILVALGFTVFGAKILWTHVQCRRLAAQCKRVLPRALKVDMLEKRNERLRVAVEEMEDLTDRKTSWTRVLQTIAGSMGSNVWVRQISVDKKNVLRMDAYSLGTDYIDFKNKMDGSLRFQDVQVGRRQKDRSGRFTTFHLTCKVLPDYKYVESFSALGARLSDKLAKTGGTIEPAPAPETLSEPPLEPPRSEPSRSLAPTLRHEDNALPHEPEELPDTVVSPDVLSKLKEEVERAQAKGKNGREEMKRRLEELKEELLARSANRRKQLSGAKDTNALQRALRVPDVRPDARKRMLKKREPRKLSP